MCMNKTTVTEKCGISIIVKGTSRHIYTFMYMYINRFMQAVFGGTGKLAGCQFSVGISLRLLECQRGFNSHAGQQAFESVVS